MIFFKGNITGTVGTVYLLKNVFEIYINQVIECDKSLISRNCAHLSTGKKKLSKSIADTGEPFTSTVNRLKPDILYLLYPFKMKKIFISLFLAHQFN